MNYKCRSRRQGEPSRVRCVSLTYYGINYSRRAYGQVGANRCQWRRCQLTSAQHPRLKEYSQIAECDYSTSDAGEIIKDPDVDGIMILTSDDMHVPLAVETLAAGKHVFVKKPLALSSEDCRKIIEVAERVDRGVMVGFWYHLHRGFLEIRRRIPHPYMITAQCAAGASGVMIDYRPRFLNRYLRNH